MFSDTKEVALVGTEYVPPIKHAFFTTRPQSPDLKWQSQV